MDAPLLPLYCQYGPEDASTEHPRNVDAVKKFRRYLIGRNSHRQHSVAWMCALSSGA